MGLEDIALFGAMPDPLILQPCDAVSTSRLVSHMAAHKGFSYMRTLRSKTPVIYNSEDDFQIGGSRILRQSANDQLTIAATGITVFEALKAADDLKKEGINVRVVDCYSISPFDKDNLRKCLQETKKRIVITVEDHYEHGGMGDFAASALADTNGRVIKMAVTKISQSGTKDELLDDAGISSGHIVNMVKQTVGEAVEVG